MSREHYIEDALSTLKENGIRITPQRQAILEFLIMTNLNRTEDEIYRAL